MIKSELILRVAAQNPHLSERTVEAVVSTILDRISGALATGGRVELRGIGIFSLNVLGARKGRNPKTGALVSITERKKINFKPGKDMQRRLNEPETHITPNLGSNAQWQSRWLGRGPAPTQRRV